MLVPTVLTGWVHPIYFNRTSVFLKFLSSSWRQERIGLKSTTASVCSMYWGMDTIQNPGCIRKMAIKLIRDPAITRFPTVSILSVYYISYHDVCSDNLKSIISSKALCIRNVFKHPASLRCLYKLELNKGQIVYLYDWNSLLATSFLRPI